MFYLYLINNNFDNSCYVGWTENPKKRMGQHRSPSKNEQHKHLYRAMAAHGRDNFHMTILEEHEILESVKQAEVAVIKMFKDTGVRLYNHSNGGDGSSGYRLTDEQYSRRMQKCRAIILITTENDEIEFNSVAECANFIGTSSSDIAYVLNGQRNNCYGFTFRYKYEQSGDAQLPRMPQAGKGHRKAIILTTEIGDEIEFDSLIKCANFTGITSTGICNVLKGKNKQYFGYTFRYKDAR